MARVQLVIPDEDRDRFAHQARREGMSLSKWLRTAAHDRMQNQQRSDPLESSADLDAFFLTCDELDGPRVEPDWQEHLMVIDESRQHGVPKA